MANQDRRTLLKGGAVLLAATAGAEASTSGTNQRPLTEKQKLDRIASNCWPCRTLFKSRSTAVPIRLPTR